MQTTDGINWETTRPRQLPQKIVTVLDGIRQKVSPGTRVEYVKGCEVIGGKPDISAAVEAARKADVVVLVVGEHPNNDGKGDVPPTDGEAFDVASLDLTGYQEELVQARFKPRARPWCWC